MSFEIQEVNGKLHRIKTIPIDAHNVKREAYPLTEEEFEKISSALGNRHKEEAATLMRFKGHPTLQEGGPRTDERDVSVPEVKRGPSMSTKAGDMEGGTAAARSKVQPKRYGVSKD